MSKAESASGFEQPRQLGDHRGRFDEDDAHVGHRGVEGGVGQAGGRRVGGHPLDGVAAGLGLGDGQQLRRDVDTCDPGTEAGGVQRRITGSTGQIDQCGAGAVRYRGHHLDGDGEMNSATASYRPTDHVDMPPLYA